MVGSGTLRCLQVSVVLCCVLALRTQAGGNQEREKKRKEKKKKGKKGVD
jgi:hypothetical protein